MGSGPVCAMVWEGREAVKVGRQLLGATNPMASSPGTIRGDFAIVSLPPQISIFHPGQRVEVEVLITVLPQDVGRNVCHGSDAVESAKKEIDLWFKKEEINSWKQAGHDWVYEK